MFRSFSLFALIAIAVTTSALAEQRVGQPKLNPQILKPSSDPQVLSKLDVQAYKLEQMEKMVAENHKMLMELKQQLGGLAQQLTGLTAQETAQQQKCGDVQARLQALQSGVTGLTTVQAQMSTALDKTKGNVETSMIFLETQVCRRQ